MEKDTCKCKNLLEGKWKFTRIDEPSAWLKDFDDSKWKEVIIPHDWSVEEDFSVEHSSGTGYLAGGMGWYRKVFELPKDLGKKRVFITFDGVYNHSQVWVNSYCLGRRPNGYSTFTYDITDFINSEDNVIAVKVEHKYEADSRWFTGSGIYRKVSLKVKESIHIEQDGVFITTPLATVEKSIINSNVTIKNTNEKSEEIKLITKLMDREKILSQSEQIYSIDSKKKLVVDNRLEVEHVNLWSIESPYLYKLVNEIIKDNQVIEKEETRVGIRSFRFDADEGFFLNEKAMKIKGVCLHHDAGCLGAAVRSKVWRRRLEKLKEMGCNAIRMSHNPHMPELYDLCDELGFLVDNEAFDEWEGVKNKWHIGHNVYPPMHHGYAEDFIEWHEQDLGEFVKRDRNHPSVIMWSIGNEIDYPNDPYCHPYFEIMTGNNDKNKPMQERIYNPSKPNAERLTVIAKRLYEIVKRYDQTRPVTLASAFPELSNLIGLTEIMDIVGYNYKEHLYQEDHAKYPNRILLGSENGHSAKNWRDVRDNQHIASQFLWTGIDFLGETVGWPYHGSEAGILDCAGFEKGIYYLRKSWWNDTPMVHLTTTYSNQEIDEIRWHKESYEIWNYPVGESISVNCYTNCEKVELYLNDNLIETKTLVEYTDLLYIPFEVRYVAGILKAIGYNGKEKVCEYVINTVGAPVQITAKQVETVINADYEDMTHIEVELVDEAGNRVIAAENKVWVEVTGVGKLMGIENGDLSDNTPYYCNYRRVKNGRLVIYVSAEGRKGNIEIKLSGEKIKGTKVIIECR
ncbi:MAG: glycoside hydrolase family 2 TIM barrel-domain containing protein [Cellulosilyticaceae bacterium]